MQDTISQNIVTRNGSSGNTGSLNRNLYAMLKFNEQAKTPVINSKKQKKHSFPKGNKLFLGDFCANLDETNPNMVQFTKRWNWKLIV